MKNRPSVRARVVRFGAVMSSAGDQFTNGVLEQRVLTLPWATHRLVDMSTVPRRPSSVSPYALGCLEALGAGGLGHTVSLGGAFALAYYHEYRATHDVDAWWVDPVGQDQRSRCIRVLEAALQEFGSTRVRRWGDVVSVELTVEGKAVFSFQIAARSSLIGRPLPAPWPGGILLDSPDDLVAGKMVALVERGAPRDIRDIHMMCTSGLVNVAECWQLWERRQSGAGEDTDRRRAALAIRTHLARLEQARPLERIEDREQRGRAEAVRRWFREEFLHGVD